jgi:hypothetical protein
MTKITYTDRSHGFTNRETFVVNMYLTKDAGLAGLAREIAMEADNVIQAGQRLESYFGAASIAGVDGLAADLIACAFARCDWREIATIMRGA